MRIYVAAKFEDLVRAREIMSMLRAEGHDITYDWTRCEQMSVGQAENDRLGVMTAQAFVLIVEKDLRYSGAITEFGMAVARRIPIFVLGHAVNIDNNIFMRMPFVRVLCDTGDLLNRLKEAEPCHT